MTGESEVERERREVVRMRDLDEGSREAELHEIAMQGRALDAAEDRGQVRGRGPDRPRDVAQPDRRGDMRREILLRAPKESSRGRADRGVHRGSRERRAQERDEPLLAREALPTLAGAAVKALGAEPLQPQVRGPAPFTKERMRGQVLLSDTQNLSQQRRVHGDNELCVPPMHRLTETKSFTACDEQDAVGVGHDVIAADMPHERPVVRQAHLEVW